MLNDKLQYYYDGYSVLNINVLSGFLFLITMYLISLNVNSDEINSFLDVYSGIFLIQLCFVSSGVLLVAWGHIDLCWSLLLCFLFASTVSFKKIPIIGNYLILAFLVGPLYAILTINRVNKV